MRSGRSTHLFVRVLALLGALAFAGPANAAWSGECEPAAPEPLLSQIGDAVGQGLAKSPVSVATILRERKARDASSIDVPFLAQQGSTCGFYAASMVLAHYDGSGQVQGRAQAESLYAAAKKAGRTTDGFVGIHELAKTISENTPHRTHVTPHATIDDLAKAIEKGRPPIVLFVVEKDPKSPNYGGPAASEPQGKNLGHFAVIEAIFTDDAGRRWVVAQHGWRGEPYVWPAEDFERSWGVRGSHMLEIKRTREQNLEARR